jgi:8-oxo-dGTP pyrophosphatase MutT (NUDIX family)
MSHNNIYQNTDLEKIKNVSIILCIKFDDNMHRILVIKEKDFSWNTPGGKVESYELKSNGGLFNAMKREFGEETGYNIDLIKMCYDQYFIYDRNHTNGSFTRIFMNCAQSSNFKFKNKNKLYFGDNYKRNGETNDIQCYTLDTILKNKTKYKKYCIDTFYKIQNFAKH